MLTVGLFVVRFSTQPPGGTAPPQMVEMHLPSSGEQVSVAAHWFGHWPPQPSGPHERFVQLATHVAALGQVNAGPPLGADRPVLVHA